MTDSAEVTAEKKSRPVKQALIIGGALLGGLGGWFLAKEPNFLGIVISSVIGAWLASYVWSLAQEP